VIPVTPFITPATTREQITGAGYTTDPYDLPEEKAELIQIGGKILYDGPFSTWREIHIGIRGAYAGLRCKTFEDLPKCPPLWEDEGQYYEGVAAIFYDLKRGGQSAVLTAITLLAGGYAKLKGIL
jgi:hypothetical protein